MVWSLLFVWCRGGDYTQRELNDEPSLEFTVAAALNMFPPCCPIFFDVPAFIALHSLPCMAPCFTLHPEHIPCANSAFTDIHASDTLILVIIPAFNGAVSVFGSSLDVKLIFSLNIANVNQFILATLTNDQCRY